MDELTLERYPHGVPENERSGRGPILAPPDFVRCVVCSSTVEGRPGRSARVRARERGWHLGARNLCPRCDRAAA